MKKQSFAPIIPIASEILILGTLPGELSLERQEYYAHPQNRFWKILFHLFNEVYQDTYQNKINILHKNHIALWDICGTATRQGSLDHHIQEVIPNPIDDLINKNESIKYIYFNGKKAEQLFESYFEKRPTIKYFTLPSSSPANAQYSFQRLIQSWSIISNNKISNH